MFKRKLEVDAIKVGRLFHNIYCDCFSLLVNTVLNHSLQNRFIAIEMETCMLPCVLFP